MANGIKIEKGVPMPELKMAPITATLKSLKVGDSFMWPGGLKNPTQRAHATARYMGLKVATRKVDGGVRVWRIA